jgi:hypothetical protein
MLHQGAEETVARDSSPVIEYNTTCKPGGDRLQHILGENLLMLGSLEPRFDAKDACQ